MLHCGGVESSCGQGCAHCFAGKTCAVDAFDLRPTQLSLAVHEAICNVLGFVLLIFAFLRGSESLYLGTFAMILKVRQNTARIGAKVL